MRQFSVDIGKEVGAPVSRSRQGNDIAEEM